MAKYAPDTTYDGLLSYVRQKLTSMTVCSTQPTNFTQGFTTYKLAIKSGMTSTYVIAAAGDTSGRKLVMQANNSLSVTATGTAAHIAWLASTLSLLLLCTTCTTQALTTGNTVNVPTHDFEIRAVA